MSKNLSILVTGANGHLGRLVVESLLARNPSARVVAGVRSLESAEALRELGVEVRQLDYDRPETLEPALEGIGRVLLVSSTGLGKRVAQHGRVIEAAKRAGVEFLVYTSILRANTVEMALAKEHHDTEIALSESGLLYAVLRNGWYTENDTAGIPSALAHGAIVGSSGAGRISAAARRDYAEAAAVVLSVSRPESGVFYELAGDSSFTKTELAAEVSRQSGQPIAYRDLPPDQYREVLLEAGLPTPVADMLAQADAETAKGLLRYDGRELSTLIGRPTTPLADTVREALANARASASTV